MSAHPKYSNCPKCAGVMDGARVCPKCGYKLRGPKPKGLQTRALHEKALRKVAGILSDFSIVVQQGDKPLFKVPVDSKAIELAFWQLHQPIKVTNAKGEEEITTLWKLWPKFAEVIGL